MNTDQNHFRAGFDMRRFARDLAGAIAADGRSLRALGAAIGVTASDLSRAHGGTNVSVEKLFAMADFMGVGLRSYYLPPELDPCKNKALHRDKRETSFVLSVAGPSGALSGKTSPPRGRALHVDDSPRKTIGQVKGWQP